MVHDHMIILILLLHKQSIILPALRLDNAGESLNRSIMMIPAIVGLFLELHHPHASTMQPSAHVSPKKKANDHLGMEKMVSCLYCLVHITSL